MQMTEASVSGAFGDLRDGLRDLLAHLFDPAYVVPAQLVAALTADGQPGEIDVRALVMRGIRELEPTPEVAPHARAWRLYRVRTLRYLEQLTQEQAAERLAISVRHLAREQAQAIDLLARHLWTARSMPTSTPGALQTAVEDLRAAAATKSPPSAQGWRQQVRKEIASLDEQAMLATSDVGKALHSAAELAGILASRRSIVIQHETADSSILVDMHPSVLSQLLVAAMTFLVRGMMGGVIELALAKTAERAIVTIAGGPVTAILPPADWLGRELLDAYGGSLAVEAEGEKLALYISIPLARTWTVLIVDDNLDLVHLYRRCLAGTPYELVHLGRGAYIFESIEATKPDVIVLDLMLPDVDGWQLLVELHEHPLSRAIPVIVCSVVHEDELALALGATACLHKPIQCEALVRALDEALNLAA